MLLRRLADHFWTPRGISNDGILHVVVGDEMTEYGSWWDITVYYDDTDPGGAESAE